MKTIAFCVVAGLLGACAASPAPVDTPRTVASEDLDAEVSAGTLISLIEALPIERSVRGDRRDIDGLRATERLIEERLRVLGYEPELQGFTYRGEDWNNIIVEIPGRSHPDRVLIVGAHFDAVTGSPGADDNGTGVATLLELARAARGSAPAMTLRLCFYNAEEAGLIGSTVDAGEIASRIDEGGLVVVGVLSLDMLGYYCDEPGCQRSPFGAIPGVFEPPDTGESIALVTTAPHRSFNRRLADAMREAEPGVDVLPVDFAPVPVGDILRSDHGPFLLLGLPGVMVTDTANFRSPHYHSPTDTVETIDRERFARTARALIGAVLRIVEEGPAPDAG